MIYPHQKTVMAALGFFDPKPTNKRAKVKAARRANVRRMQRERARGRAVPKPRFRIVVNGFRQMEKAFRHVGKSVRDLSRALESFPYYTGGTVTGRFKGAQPDAERLTMARTRPLRETKVIVESTPLSGADYSEIEKRVMATLSRKTEIFAETLAKQSLQKGKSE